MNVRIAVLVSGGGSNLQAIIDAVETGYIKNTEIVCVISNKENAFGLNRARNHKIEAIFLDSKNKSRQEFTTEIISELKNRKIDLVCLAGFMVILSDEIFTPENYKNKIINIHPALLPEFGGEGMFGMNVHQAVYAAGKKVSGATVHFVNEICDGGDIILQEKIDIFDCKSPEEIAKKVLKIEHKIYPEAVKFLVERVVSDDFN